MNEVEKLAGFARDFIIYLLNHNSEFFGSEWSEDICPILTQHGLMEKVKYDPDIHGYIEDAEPGYDIWMFKKEILDYLTND